MSYTLILHFEKRKCIDVVPNLMNPYLIQSAYFSKFYSTNFFKWTYLQSVILTILLMISGQSAKYWRSRWLLEFTAWRSTVWKRIIIFFFKYRTDSVSLSMKPDACDLYLSLSVNLSKLIFIFLGNKKTFSIVMGWYFWLRRDQL